MACGKLSKAGNGYYGTRRNRLRALVVESIRVCQMVCEVLLQTFGVDTYAVNNGEDAFELLASNDVFFNLIVIDSYLPGMNGIEVTRRIREMGVNCTIVGTSVTASEREAFLAAGVDEFIEMPFTLENMAPIVERID